MVEKAKIPRASLWTKAGIGEEALAGFGSAGAVGGENRGQHLADRTLAERIGAHCHLHHRFGMTYAKILVDNFPGFAKIVENFPELAYERSLIGVFQLFQLGNPDFIMADFFRKTGEIGGVGAGVLVGHDFAH